MAKTGRL